ncbi:MAG: GNAT family N-acetyltransferase [Candidatus Hydrogenedentes bacterium]|nr:GNAT family N-acetyltransferase [Candidatus Hydrogenedentota bacterium]
MSATARAMEFLVKSVECNDELRQIHALFAENHPLNGDAREAYNYLQTNGAGYPQFEQEHTRIVTRGREVVAGLRLTTDTLRLGEARLKMGGIGWVTTAAAYRGRGICTLLMHDVIAYMKQHRYHVSMLFGIPDFYHRFNYVTTLADYAIRMDTREALTFEAPFQIRPGKVGDIRAIQKIHTADDQDVACSLLRTARHIGCKWHRLSEMKVMTDDQGKVLAYIVIGEGSEYLEVREVGALEPGMLAGVVGACGRIAAAMAYDQVKFRVPPTHVFARYMLQFRSLHETHVQRDAGGMMAFIDIGETLESMIPEWESRIAESAIRDISTECTLVVGQHSYRLRAHRGALNAAAANGKNKISLTEGELMHLLTGYRYLDDVLNGKRLLLTLDARHLLETLFPKRCPFVWPFDRF